MKLFMLFTLFYSLTALASSFDAYQKSDTQLASDILSTCPSEASQILKQERSSSLVGGDYSSGMEPGVGFSGIYYFHFNTMNDDGDDKAITLKAKVVNDTVNCSVLDGHQTNLNSVK
jgi:hypothetical protein